MLKITLKILNYFKFIQNNDIIILKTIENLMSFQRRVKIEDIVIKTGFSDPYIRNKLKFFNKIDLVETQRNKGQYINVRLKFMAYDALALHDLVDRNILSSIGGPIGVGKESNVYRGLLNNKEECVLKFHKLGKTKFKATKRKRDFLANKKHSSRLFESTLNAKREVEALKKLSGLVPVPHVFGYSRHVIVMQKIDGIEIFKSTSLKESDYFNIFNKLIPYIKIIVEAGIIHGDLSVFNILLTSNNGDFGLYIIDWPQFLRISHQNAFDALLSDLNNIYTYFLKKTYIKPINIESYGLELLNNAKKNLKLRKQ